MKINNMGFTAVLIIPALIIGACFAYFASDSYIMQNGASKAVHPYEATIETPTDKVNNQTAPVQAETVTESTLVRHM